MRWVKERGIICLHDKCVTKRKGDKQDKMVLTKEDLKAIEGLFDNRFSAIDERLDKMDERLDNVCCRRN